MQKMKMGLVIIIAALQSCHTTVEAKDKNQLLVGSWRFVADQELDNNNLVKNEDTNVKGLLIYTADGKMSVQLFWYGRRSSMMNDTIMNQDGQSSGLGTGNNTWTLDQTRKIIDTYDAYFGDYSVDWKNKIVIHTINGNLRPEKDRTSYKRSFQINGDTLFLRSAEPGTNIKWQAKWIKDK